MALAHNLGFPQLGRDRELQRALAACRRGELDEAGLRAVGRGLRAAHWQVQRSAGIELLPVGDFAWCDRVLGHSRMFGVIPGRLGAEGGAPASLPGLAGEAHAGALGEWFGSGRHYRVPEFACDQQFALGCEQLFEEVQEGQFLGHALKPVLLGPLTYLWLGKCKGREFDRLELLERLLPVYGEILRRLAGQGIDWVQIDEPILALDLPQAWKNAFERAYNLLQREPGRKLIATYFAGLGDNLGLAAGLPVDGLHVDLASAPEQLATVLDRLPAYKVLSLGVVDGRHGGGAAVQQDLEALRQARERLGSRLWLAPSCSLQHVPGEAAPGLALAAQKCREVAALAKALRDEPAAA